MLARKWWVSWLWLALAGSLAQAQIFGTVRGSVVDPQDLPIQHAQVSLHDRASSWSAQTQTDAAGEFRMATVPAGSYTIEVEYEGFRTVRQLLDLAIGSAPSSVFPWK